MIVVALSVPSAALANFVRSGDCAIIVASRQTLDDAFEYIRDNDTDADAIYASKNGWYATSVGTITDAGSTDFLATLVERRAIPQDSYCSTGEAYTRLAWSRPAKSATTTGTASILDTPFDARPLNTQEKRYVQAGLALEGTYSGLIDGDWGRASQTAYEAYMGKRDWPDSNRSAAVLTILTADALEDGQWTNFYMPAVNASISYPAASMSAVENT